MEYYKQYVKVSRGVSDKSVGHYVTGLNTINTLLSKYDYPIKSVFDAQSVNDLDDISRFLVNNDEFKAKDATGHHMYSVAFKHFYHFATEDKEFFENRLETMDISIAKPQKLTSTTSHWKRNQILIAQAIDGAHHLCERDHGHITFTAKATGKAYMEGHHLIPLKYQSEFDCGIDVYANIVCLCPICHRLLHFGTTPEKTYAAEELFDCRKNRLIRSGIDMPKSDFLKLVI